MGLMCQLNGPRRRKQEEAKTVSGSLVLQRKRPSHAGERVCVWLCLGVCVCCSCVLTLCYVAAGNSTKQANTPAALLAAAIPDVSGEAKGREHLRG